MLITKLICRECQKNFRNGIRKFSDNVKRNPDLGTLDSKTAPVALPLRSLKGNYYFKNSNKNNFNVFVKTGSESCRSNNHSRRTTL